MAKRKNHLQASPLFLSAGLVAVMVFAIIIGVSQVNQTQITSSTAQEVTGNVQPQTNPQSPESGSGCTLYVNDPSPSSGQVKSYLSVVCSKVYPEIVWVSVASGGKTGIYADGKFIPGSDSSADCRNCSTLGKTISAYLWSGTYTYCAWATVDERDPYYVLYSQGPKRSTNCITVKH